MAKKKYSSLEKRLYYQDRAIKPYQNNIEPYSSKHVYALGYNDGSSSDESDYTNIKKQYGNKKAFFYLMGFKKGLKNKFGR